MTSAHSRSSGFVISREDEATSESAAEAGAAEEYLSLEHLSRLFDSFASLAQRDTWELREDLAHLASLELCQPAESRDILPILQYEALLRAQYAVLVAAKRPTAIFSDHARAWGRTVRSTFEHELRWDAPPIPESERSRSGLLKLPTSLGQITFKVFDYPSSAYLDVLAAALHMLASAYQDGDAPEPNRDLVDDSLEALRRLRHDLPQLAHACPNSEATMAAVHHRFDAFSTTLGRLKKELPVEVETESRRGSSFKVKVVDVA